MLGENYWSDPGGLTNMKNSDYVKIRYTTYLQTCWNDTKINFFSLFQQSPEFQVITNLSENISPIQNKTPVFFLYFFCFYFQTTC